MCIFRSLPDCIRVCTCVFQDGGGLPKLDPAPTTSNTLELPEMPPPPLAALPEVRDFNICMQRLREASFYPIWRDLPELRALNAPLHRNEEYYAGLFNKFFDSRGISHLLTSIGLTCLPTSRELPFFYWAYENVNDARNFGRPIRAFHGTSWPFLRSILGIHGMLHASTGTGCTRAAFGQGVYCSPRLHHTCASKYAVPQMLFSDGAYHKVVLALDVDEADPSFRRITSTGSVEWLAAPTAVKILGLIVFPNTGAKCQEPRIPTWDPLCEP